MTRTHQLISMPINIKNTFLACAVNSTNVKNSADLSSARVGIATFNFALKNSPSRDATILAREWAAESSLKEVTNVKGMLELLFQEVLDEPRSVEELDEPLSQEKAEEHWLQQKFLSDHYDNIATIFSCFSSREEALMGNHSAAAAHDDTFQL